MNSCILHRISFSLPLMTNENQSPAEMQLDNYIPGTCNLGVDEVEKRRRNIKIGLLATILGIICIQYFNLSREWRLMVFIPLFYSAICFFQARQKFCVVYGVLGIFNFGKLGNYKKVIDDEYKKQDKKRALQILFISFSSSLIATAVYYLLPF